MPARRISNRLCASSGGGDSAASPALLRQVQGPPPLQRAPARLAARAPGLASAIAAEGPEEPAAAGPAAVDPEHPTGAATAASNASAAGRVSVESGMRRGAAAVDADATLTYHRFFMSRPFA